LLFSQIAVAQFDTGTITGSVTDPTGAVVPNATITITNTGTSDQRILKSDSGGNFVASALPFGNYVVSASANNFGEAKTQQIVLNVGATVHVNVTMQVATASENIEVTGTLTTVDTQTTNAGTTLDANQISNLPVNGRDVSDFFPGQRERVRERVHGAEHYGRRAERIAWRH
jgi:hypothetical protein